MTCPLSPQSDGGASDESPAPTSFRALCCSLPGRVSRSMAENASVPICFVCLLHLANERVSSCGVGDQLLLTSSPFFPSSLSPFLPPFLPLSLPPSEGPGVIGVSRPSGPQHSISKHSYIGALTPAVMFAAALFINNVVFHTHRQLCNHSRE